MDPAVEARLRAHVAAIVAGSAVPQAERDDLAEELLGHLVERWHELVAGGLDAADAAERAVVGFGDPDDLAPDFRATYHSRLWASTIGVLLPLERATDRPSVITWLGALMGLAAVFAGIGAVAMVLTQTPVRAVAAGLGSGAGCVVLSLAWLALVRGQRWAYRVALAVAGLMVVQGIVQALAGPGLQISLTGLLAAITLIRATDQGPAVEGWLRPSPHIPRPLVVTISVCVALSYGLGWGVSAIPDPTQIGPGDVDARAAVACGRGGAEFDDPDAWRTVTVTVSLHWTRADLYPRGLVNGDAYGSALTFGLASPTGAFVASGAATIEIVEPGDASPPGYESGTWGNTVPDEVRFVQSVRGIGSDLIAAGRTIRVTAQHMASAELAEQAGGFPAHVDVSYYHLDRFVLRARLTCGQEGPLRDG